MPTLVGGDAGFLKSAIYPTRLHTCNLKKVVEAQYKSVEYGMKDIDHHICNDKMECNGLVE
jgi:hypothetical protein